MVLKALISTGEINAGNEWRLNPERSIRGGVYYLKKLVEYWTQFKVRNQLQEIARTNIQAEKTAFVLASYNSGISRVLRAINAQGLGWLAADDLSVARDYVSKITSYCFHFSDCGVKL